MTALAGSLLAQVKRPTHNSLQYAASVAASLCQSHVSVMRGLNQPVRLCLAFSTRLHLCLHDWWREGGNKCLCGKQIRKRTQPTWKTNLLYIYKIHPTVWIMSNSKQSGGRASVPRWFCIWKDASLTRSGSFCVCACVCVCVCVCSFWQHFSCARIGCSNEKAFYSTA